MLLIMGEHSASVSVDRSGPPDGTSEHELRTGELRFAEADERIRLSTGLGRQRFLIVKVTSIGPSSMAQTSSSSQASGVSSMSSSTERGVRR